MQNFGKSGPISWALSKGNAHQPSPTLVLLHGIMGSKRNWGRVAKHLLPNFNILTYDLRGHGASEHLKAPHTLSEHRNDLKNLLDDLEIEKAQILGHSMGGRVAAEFAATHPERVKALILEDTSPVLSEAASNWVKEMLSAVPTPFESRAAARAWLTKNIENRQIGEFLYTNIRENEEKGADWIFYENGVRESLDSMRQTPMHESMKKLSCPTLIVRGENSTHFLSSEFIELQNRFPNFEFVEIRGAAHWVHADNFPGFVHEVSQFLMRVNSKP